MRANEEARKGSIETVSNLGEKREVKSVRSVLTFCQHMSSPFHVSVTWFMSQWDAL